jgi:hypothetical protein
MTKKATVGKRYRSSHSVSTNVQCTINKVQTLPQSCRCGHLSYLTNSAAHAALEAVSTASFTAITPLHLEHLSSKTEKCAKTVKNAIAIPFIFTAGFVITNNLDLYEC